MPQVPDNPGLKEEDGECSCNCAETFCEHGHVLEMSGVGLYRHLTSLGKNVLCPECVRWVKVASITDGRIMSEQEKEEQAKD